jgi:ABC-2 type transport system ATP-binding protein
MLKSSIENRTSEIEKLVAANELNTATKRIMDLVSDFSINRKRKQEAIDIRASYNALREESRRYGKLEDENQELSKLRYRILDFIEAIKEEDPSSQRQILADTIADNQLSESIEKKTGESTKTKFELEKETFSKQRYQVSARKPTIVFYAKNICKKYNGRSIDFSLNLTELKLRLGEITSIVGENGNGKTTLLRIIAGQLKITSGNLEYPYLISNGKNDLYSVKQQIAYIPQELNRWPGELEDNLHFAATIHGINGQQNEDEVAFILSRLGLDQYRNATWNEISGGYRMRFALAKALIANPRLIILDEPLANLDINAQQFFLQDLRYLADSVANPKTIIISSQHLYSIEGITDNIIFIANGNAIYNGKVQDFGNDRKDNSFEISCNQTKESLLEILDEIPRINIDKTGNYFIITTDKSVTPSIIISIFMKHNIEISYFRDISKSTRRLFKLDK